MSLLLILLFWIDLISPVLGFRPISTSILSLGFQLKETSSSLHHCAKSSTHSGEYGLLFDCDGVLVETEELHRQAYNRAFADYGLTLPGQSSVIEWSVEYYDILQNSVGGGGPKMFHYFDNTAKAWPTTIKIKTDIDIDIHRNIPGKLGKPTLKELGLPNTIEEKHEFVNGLLAYKTECYKAIIEQGVSVRPGVVELIDEAIRDPLIKVGICSASQRGGLEKILEVVLGSERVSQLDVVIAGDDVEKKKPHPMIYNVARDRINIPSHKCVVVEDSMVGLRAAKGANMRCIITYTDSTINEEFYAQGADAKVPNLRQVNLASIFEPLRNGEDEILLGIRD